MKITTVFKLSGAILAAGILFGLGQRIGQGLLPAPDVRISLCSPGSDGSDEVCVSLGDAEDGPFPDEAPTQGSALPQPVLQRL